MRKGNVVIFIFILLVSSYFVQAQENHYWMSQVGARSTMLSAAVVGSVRDNSSIFYNPGAQAFIYNSSLSVVGNVYYLDNLKMKNSMGDGIDTYSTEFGVNPQLV